MKSLSIFLLVIAAVLSARPQAVAAQEIRQERVHFKAGASSVTITGSITGEETIDYVLGARTGQTMSVTLKTSKGAHSFNVLPPGSPAAIGIGETSGNAWTGCRSTGTTRCASP